MWLQLNTVLPFQNIYERSNFQSILSTITRDTIRTCCTCIIGDIGSGKTTLSIEILIQLLKKENLTDKYYYFYIHNDYDDNDNIINRKSYLITPNLEIYKIVDLKETILLTFKHPFIVISDGNIDITLSLIKNSNLIGHLLKSVIFTLSYKQYKKCENILKEMNNISLDNLKTIYLPVYTIKEINEILKLYIPTDLINKLYNQYGGDMTSILSDLNSYNSNEICKNYLSYINYDFNSFNYDKINITNFAINFQSPYWIEYKKKIDINRNISFISIYNNIKEDNSNNNNNLFSKLFIHTENNKIEYKSKDIRNIIRNFVLPISSMNEYDIGCEIYRKLDKYLLNDIYHDLIQYILPFIKEIQCKPYYINNRYVDSSKMNIIKIPINHNKYIRNVLINDNNIKVIKDEYSSFDLINNNLDSTVNIDGYSYIGYFKICNDSEISIFKDVNEYSQVLNPTYNSLFIITDKSIDDIVIKEIDKYDDKNDVKYHPIIRKYIEKMSLQPTDVESTSNDENVYPSLIPSDYEVKYKSNKTSGETIFNKNLEIFIASITIKEIELLKQNISVSQSIIPPTSVNGIFSKCVGWFSSSVPTNIKNVWIKEGGVIVDSIPTYPIITDKSSNKGYYLFADDSECDDVKDIFKNISFDMKGETVKYIFRSEYIINKINNVNEKIQKYILPPHYTQAKQEKKKEKKVESVNKSPKKIVQNNNLTMNYETVSFIYEEKESNKKRKQNKHKQQEKPTENEMKIKKNKTIKQLESEIIEEEDFDDDDDQQQYKIEIEEEEEEGEEISIPKDVLKDYKQAYQLNDELLMKILQDLVGINHETFLNEIKNDTASHKRKYK